MHLVFDVDFCFWAPLAKKILDDAQIFVFATFKPLAIMEYELLISLAFDFCGNIRNAGPNVRHGLLKTRISQVS